MAEKQEAKGLLTSESGNSAPIPQNSPPVVVTKAEVGDIAEKTYEKLLSKTAIGIIVWVLAIILSFIVGNLFVITKDMYGKIHELNGKSERETFLINSLSDKIKFCEKRSEELEKQNEILNSVISKQKDLK